MIIKSMTRKAPTFDQLAQYIERDAEGSVSFAHNLHYDGSNPKLVATIFQSNYRYLPPRKNGNALYHVVLVLPEQSQLDRNAIQRALQDLGHKFCERFAPEQLAWGRAHFNTDNPHIHLMISSNAVRSNRRHRLDKASFAKIQRDLESYKEQRYPELQDLTIYGRQSAQSRARVTATEGEWVRRTGQPSQKQKVRQTVYDLLCKSPSKSVLEGHLNEAGFELYKRGQSWAVIERATGRRYRFKTLGLEPELLALLNRKPERVKPHQIEKSGSESRTDQLLHARQNQEAAAREELDGFERDDER